MSVDFAISKLIHTYIVPNEASMFLFTSFLHRCRQHAMHDHIFFNTIEKAREIDGEKYV